jgi:hypothetical protein
MKNKKHMQYVVKFNSSTELYMIGYNPNYSLCRWGTLDNPELLTWDSLAGAQAAATSINSGTVGLPKPS